RRAERRGGPGRLVDRPARDALGEVLHVPGLPPADPARPRARGRLRERQPLRGRRRPGRPAALALGLLVGARSAPVSSGTERAGAFADADGGLLTGLALPRLVATDLDGTLLRSDGS